MNKYIYFSLILSTVIIMSSCEPKESKECQVICNSVNSAPQELLDYFIFNEGSYWVYQLNGTDTFDTLSFAGMNSEYFEKKTRCNYGIPPCEMRYDVFYNHSNLDQFPSGNLKVNSSNEQYYITYSSLRDQWDVRHITGARATSSLNLFLAYPFLDNQKYTETTFLVDTEKEVSVPAGTFKCLHTQSQVSDPTATIMFMYWSQKVGLIKYQISTNQTWELINYHLN